MMRARLTIESERAVSAAQSVREILFELIGGSAHRIRNAFDKVFELGVVGVVTLDRVSKMLDKKWVFCRVFGSTKAEPCHDLNKLTLSLGLRDKCSNLVLQLKNLVSNRSEGSDSHFAAPVVVRTNTVAEAGRASSAVGGGLSL